MADTQTKPNPVDQLAQAAFGFAAKRLEKVVTDVGSRASGNGQESAKQGFASGAAGQAAGGAGPVKSAAVGVKESVKNLFGKGGGKKSKRPTNIVEEIIIGAPREVVFGAWTNYEQHAEYMKGVESVTRDDSDEAVEEKTNWSVKIFLNKRRFEATTTEYDPPRRIAWTSEGDKGTVDGTITFHEISDGEATLMLVVLEYKPAGFFEWWGNRWRTVGRRVRLDLKHFRRYVMRTDPEELSDLAVVGEGAEEGSDG